MADDFVVDVVGLDVVDRALGALHARLIQAGFEVLPGALEPVLEEAKALAPVDTGALRDSGYIGDPIQVGDAVAVAIGFGEDLDYALDQHENPNYEHADGKSDKFLEIPLAEWTGEGPEQVARAIAERMATP